MDDNIDEFDLIIGEPDHCCDQLLNDTITEEIEQNCGQLEDVLSDDSETCDIDMANHEQDPLSLSNCGDFDQGRDISKYFNEPSTPKKKNKKFKMPKSPPVLTSRKRIEWHQKKEEEKENLKKEKVQKAEEKRKIRAKRAEEKQKAMIQKATERLERLKSTLKEIKNH